VLVAAVMNVLVSVLVIVANVFGRIKIKSEKDITTHDDLLDGLRLKSKGITLNKKEANGSGEV
jgi:hypothetical protein